MKVGFNNVCGKRSVEKIKLVNKIENNIFEIFGIYIYLNFCKIVNLLFSINFLYFKLVLLIVEVNKIKLNGNDFYIWNIE